MAKFDDVFNSLMQNKPIFFKCSIFHQIDRTCNPNSCVTEMTGEQSKAQSIESDLLKVKQTFDFNFSIKCTQNRKKTETTMYLTEKIIRN